MITEKERELKAITLYNEGLTLREIAFKINSTRKTIGLILNRNRVIRRSFKIHPKKYYVDEDFFSQINSPEKAYFLGWLMSDGCNYVPKNRISINLKSDDRNMLKILKSLISNNYPILDGVRKNGGQYTNFQFISRKISNDLTKIGCTEKKSLNLEFPELTKNLLSHFMRGYFEGDGTIYIDKTWNRYIIGIVSSDNFCFTAQKILNNLLEIGFKNNKEGKISKLKLNKSKDIKIFLEWIYKDAGVMKLSRKYNRYIEFKSSLQNKGELI